MSNVFIIYRLHIEAPLDASADASAAVSANFPCVSFVFDTHSFKTRSDGRGKWQVNLRESNTMLHIAYVLPTEQPQAAAAAVASSSSSSRIAAYPESAAAAAAAAAVVASATTLVTQDWRLDSSKYRFEISDIATIGSVAVQIDKFGFKSLLYGAHLGRVRTERDPPRFDTATPFVVNGDFFITARDTSIIELQGPLPEPFVFQYLRLNTLGGGKILFPIDTPPYAMVADVCSAEANSYIRGLRVLRKLDLTTTYTANAVRIQVARGADVRISGNQRLPESIVRQNVWRDVPNNVTRQDELDEFYRDVLMTHPRQRGNSSTSSLNETEDSEDSRLPPFDFMTAHVVYNVDDDDGGGDDGEVIYIGSTPAAASASASSSSSSSSSSSPSSWSLAGSYPWMTSRRQRRLADADDEVRSLRRQQEEFEHLAQHAGVAYTPWVGAFAMGGTEEEEELSYEDRALEIMRARSAEEAARQKRLQHIRDKEKRKQSVRRFESQFRRHDSSKRKPEPSPATILPRPSTRSSTRRRVATTDDNAVAAAASDQDDSDRSDDENYDDSDDGSDVSDADTSDYSTTNGGRKRRPRSQKLLQRRRRRPQLESQPPLATDILDAATKCCTICLDNLTENRGAFNCGHLSFCYKCARAWYIESGSCPLCRTKINLLRPVKIPLAPVPTMPPPQAAVTCSSSTTNSDAPSRRRRR